MNLYLVRNIINASNVPASAIGVSPIFKNKKKANEYANLCGAKVEPVELVEKRVAGYKEK
jgi:hypothetical protein